LLLLEPLNPLGWHKLRDSVSTPLNFDSSERIGIHPTILEIIQGCVLSTENCSYKIQYEKKKIDDEGIIKIPDISIVKNDEMSNLVISTVIPIEVKKENKLNSAIHQSLGYLLGKLRDQFKIAASDCNKLFGFCLTIDGTNLSLGYIAIKKYALNKLYTGVCDIQLWSRQSTMLR
jgi:hypothetical protein